MKKKWIVSILIVLLTLSMSGCGKSAESTKETYEDQYSVEDSFEFTADNSESEKNAERTKGTYQDPYSIEDSLEFTAGDIVPYSFLRTGRYQIINPIKLKISNVQVTQWTVTEFSEYSDYFYRVNGIDNENWYFIKYDVEIMESDIYETVDLSDYFSVYCLGADGQRRNELIEPGGVPKELTDGLSEKAPTVIPLEGKSWSCYTWLAPENGEKLDYVLFNYCGEDEELHDIYVKV